MNLLVCVKQVPDTTEITIDPETNRLNREGVESILNPFDACALELALRLKEETNGTVTVLSMGPKQAQVALKECIAIGADKAYLLTDRLFGGSDTLATSYILSKGIEFIDKFDVVFCGKQAIDGDTGQVGAEIAQHLGYALASYCFSVEKEGDKLKIQTETEDGYQTSLIEMPAVLTVPKNNIVPRYPTLKSKMAANKAVIEIVTSENVTVDREKIGLGGSPTKVKKTFVPSFHAKGEIIKEETPQKAAAKLIDLLSENKIV